VQSLFVCLFAVLIRQRFLYTNLNGPRENLIICETIDRGAGKNRA